MRTLANILWLFLGGLETALAWAITGLVFCLTIIGIPLGSQCFKMAQLSLVPFGQRVTYGGGVPSLLANIVWLIVGIPMAIAYLVIGAAWCLTIVGIPIGMQAFKMAKLSLMPFGAEVYYAA